MPTAFLPEPHHQKKSPKSLKIFASLFNQISSHPCLWISIVLLLMIPLVLVSVTPSCFPNCNTAVISNSGDCPFGRIYAYDLPSMFNDDLLLHNCSDLDLWNWQCGLTANHGLGGLATELRRVLPENLSNFWYRTNQYALELIVHRRILQHKCRTLEPESAAAFYIPFYAGLAVGKHLWTNNTAKRDHHCEMLLRWVLQQNYWKKLNGSDHFMAVGRMTYDFRRLEDPDLLWGSAFFNMPEMQRVTRFIVEGLPGDDRDVSVPYPTGFHPQTGEALKNWQDFVREHSRSSLFTFVGAAREWVRNDFRALLLSYCSSESPSCRAVDCATAHCAADSSASLESFLGSEFCLQPKGDTYTRRSIFDCMIAGSVPVFFWKKTIYKQYEWFLPGEPESYSVFINHEEVRNGSSIIKEVLMKYGKNKIRRMRDKVIETIPRIIYGIENGGSKDFEDAFDIALRGALERMKQELEWSHKRRET